MSADELVHLEVAGGVARIILDSPHNRNALSRRLLADLDRQVRAAAGDERARVIVLTGAGPVFCSGADLKEPRAVQDGDRATPSGDLVGIVTALRESPKPVVGRINGPARAGGLGLTCACDIAIAVEAATFAFSEVRVGVAPAIISVVTLPRLGPARALELFLTGDVFDAPTAAGFGLINAAVPREELDAAVGRYVASLLLGGPNALGETKRLVREVPGLPVAEAFRRMAALSARLFASEEAREGMAAFAERRPPRWARPTEDAAGATRGAADPWPGSAPRSP
jgi:methylglutaconyl-CoA hydratase